MPPLSLVPEAVPLLCQLLIAGTATLYLVSLPRRTRATRWLTATLGLGAMFSLSFLAATLAPAGSGWAFRANLLLYASILLSMLAGVQAAYTFLATPFRREQRVAALASGALAVALIAPSIWAAATLDLWLAEALMGPYGIALVAAALWAIVVSVRQSGRLRRLAMRESSRREARLHAVQGHHAFAALVTIDLALAVLNAGVAFGMLPPLALQYGSLLGQIAVSVGFVVLVINYAPEPTTVQAKLVGLALACVLAALGVASLVTLQPSEVARAAGNVVPERVLLRFEPAARGGYSVEQREPGGDAEGGGTAVPGSAAMAAGGVVPVDLPFSFPYGGRAVARVWVGCFPVLSLERGPGSPSPAEILYGDRSSLLVFVGPGLSVEGECVRTEATAGRVAFEWHRRDLAGRTARHHAVLYASGAFELAYSGPRLHPTIGGVGFKMPGAAPYVEASLAGGLPLAVPSGSGLLDDYGPRYRAAAQARTLPLALLVLGATAFVLLLFPLFLQRSVLGPLRELLSGVERVQLGDREARVASRATTSLGSWRGPSTGWRGRSRLPRRGSAPTQTASKAASWSAPPSWSRRWTRSVTPKTNSWRPRRWRRSVG